MRTCETNFDPAAVAYEEPGLFYDPIEADEQVMYDEPEIEREIPGEKKHYIAHTRGRRAEEKKGRRVASDIGFYFGQLKKFSKEYLAPEKIKNTYDTVKDYERAILSIFYAMDSFQEGLNEIRRTFERKEQGGKKSNNHSPYTKEQLQFIAKISRKPLYKNDDKEAEISRVTVILEEICSRGRGDREKTPLDFQALFERLPFKNDSYVDFINYLHKMVGRIEANKWGEKTKKATAALQTYSGVNYTRIRDAFIFLNTINELDFESTYYYKKPFSYLKKITRGICPDSRINQADDIDLESLSGVAPDLARKSIERTARYEQEITNLLNHFSEQYFRYVIFVAKRFMNGRLSFSDIIQEGNIGLLKAVKKFNYELGHKFITYAFWWIRQGITRALADQSRTIRVPFHIHQEYYNIKKAMPGHKKNILEEPDFNYISAATGKSEKHLKKIFELFEYPLSLNQETKRGSCKPLCAFKPDIKAVDPCMHLEKATLKEDIYYYLNSLTKREVELIEMRFGLKDGNECTLDEVARKLHVTRERVRQIELHVLNRLKKCGEDRLKPHLKRNLEDVDYCIN